MKSVALPSPALCGLPLIESSRSPAKGGDITMEHRPTGFLARLVAKVWAALSSQVPVGYEDATGFHYGGPDL